MLISVTIDAAPDSPRATATVRALRDKVHAVPDAAAKVGGYTATNLDLQLTAQRDRQVVIPLVLGLVLVVLMLLLRAVVAPLILVATVILSFAATLGVCGVMFRDVFGFAGRSRRLSQLDGLLDAASRSPAVVISAASGTAGVGKTTQRRRVH